MFPSNIYSKRAALAGPHSVGVDSLGAYGRGTHHYYVPNRRPNIDGVHALPMHSTKRFVSRSWIEHSRFGKVLRCADKFTIHIE